MDTALVLERHWFLSNQHGKEGSQDRIYDVGDTGFFTWYLSTTAINMAKKGAKETSLAAPKAMKAVKAFCCALFRNVVHCVLYASFTDILLFLMP